MTTPYDALGGAHLTSNESRPNDPGSQLPGSYPPAPPAPPKPLRPRKSRAGRILMIVALAVSSWAVGLAMGVASSPDDDRAPTADQAAVDEADPPSRPRSTPATTEADSYTPTPADFTINVVTLSKACFGSAGCNVTFTIELGYQGPQPLDPSDSWQVIYDVTGGESVRTDTATVNGTSYTYSPETMISTGGEGAVLTATPTLVRSAG